jgi:hypothetical protein
MNEPVEVEVVDRAGAASAWLFDCLEGDALRTIVATDPVGAERSGSGEDWFDALRQLRVTMEAEGLRPLCAGARTNARPSGMLGQSTGGSVVYLLHPGRQPVETAGFLDPAPLQEIGTVEEQDVFYERWLRSSPQRGLTAPLTEAAQEWWTRIKYR